MVNFPINVFMATILGQELTVWSELFVCALRLIVVLFDQRAIHSHVLAVSVVLYAIPSKASHPVPSLVL